MLTNRGVLSFLLLFVTAYVRCTASQLALNVALESSSTTAAPAPQCLTKDAACIQQDEGDRCCSGTYCKQTQNTYPLRFSCVDCLPLGQYCSGRNFQCCAGTDCVETSFSSSGGTCRPLCKRAGAECAAGSDECCNNECRRSDNSSNTFKCTKVARRDEECGPSDSETPGTPCASGLVCELRAVENSLARLLPEQLLSRIVPLEKAFLCTQPCSPPNGPCNNFLVGQYCCNDTYTASSNIFCKNERGDGIAQIIGTCKTCANNKGSCSSDSDCCVERKDFCRSGTCTKCVLSGFQCKSRSDTCCVQGTQCQRTNEGGFDDSVVYRCQTGSGT